MTHLSPREREVVELIGGEGVGYKAAGKRLGISAHTVREHVRRIARRLQSSRAPREAVVVLYHRERVTTAGAPAEGDC